MTKEIKPIWTEEDEIAYQAGDMDGILYQDENRDSLPTPIKSKITEKAGKFEKKIDSGDIPDIKLTDIPYYERK